MFLTDEEKRMRDGAEGDAVAAAMDLLIRYGYAVDAERLCDIRNVAGTMTQPSPVKARLVAEGGWDKAFAVINLIGRLTAPISLKQSTATLNGSGLKGPRGASTIRLTTNSPATANQKQSQNPSI